MTDMLLLKLACVPFTLMYIHPWNGCHAYSCHGDVLVHVCSTRGDIALLTVTVGRLVGV